MKKKGKLLRAFAYTSLIVLGIIIGIAFGHYNNLPLSEEINLIDIAALIVTIFLAVYVPAVLDQRLQILNRKKDILESRIADYQSLVRRVNMMVQENHTTPFDNPLTLRNLLDISGHRLDTIVSLIRNSGLDSALNRDVASIKQMNEKHKELLLNSTDAIKSPKNYNANILEQEELLYNQIDEATSLLIFKVNNSQ